MSNRAWITPTKFEDLRTGDVSYGVRVHDDYAMTFDDSWEAIPEDDLEILARVLKEADEATQAILASVQENQRGCYLGGSWYTWEEIKSLWEHDPEEPNEETDP